ncbi:E3 ubiquitin-protein ligase RNF4 isoform X1 [Herrania umbratica]|uniref:E3 ubiquitin-protein ligase RNF4 isoform X1 n=1 Tax=Herrania umbratica TaxID=108875 RepID=A0A6J1BSQ8_9ROSI|nr:E3 ubiquitin-protein ligase RNF4 isoform X1 [Herrania umbratica]XP_021301249.1 E3 ubiquitin-protein ligase RNF4 isoform X1 [Herrania umbratica]
MSTLEVRGPSLRGYRRRKAVLDLNVPPSEIREQEGTSQQAGSEELSSQPLPPVPPATIDVEAFDDDVIESSARAFAEILCQAKNNSRRSRGRTVLVDLDSGQLARSTNNNHNRRRRLPPSQTVINCDHYINLESTAQTMVEEIIKPQPPPKEPTFNCPICMGPLVEEMSTRCGHIFCKACIKAAIAAQGKCPTCRKRVTVKELIRVFLPSAS